MSIHNGPRLNALESADTLENLLRQANATIRRQGAEIQRLQALVERREQTIAGITAYNEALIEDANRTVSRGSWKGRGMILESLLLGGAVITTVSSVLTTGFMLRQKRHLVSAAQIEAETAAYATFGVERVSAALTAEKRHDERITELLEKISQETERRRAAENRAGELQAEVLERIDELQLLETELAALKQVYADEEKAADAYANALRDADEAVCFLDAELDKRGAPLTEIIEATIVDKIKACYVRRSKEPAR
jgi:hypothetical protein